MESVVQSDHLMIAFDEMAAGLIPRPIELLDCPRGCADGAGSRCVARVWPHASIIRLVAVVIATLDSWLIAKRTLIVRMRGRSTWRPPATTGHMQMQHPCEGPRDVGGGHGA